MPISHDVVLYGGLVETIPDLALVINQMPYLMIETADKGIEFIATANLKLEPHWTVLRYHAFGKGGDLLIRRDEAQLMWRFVGTQSTLDQLKLPEGEAYPLQLSYDDDKDNYALLWGEYDTNRARWYENRVGKATLDYPQTSPDWQRVQIRARQVTDKSGHIVAYWTYTLVEHPQQEQA